MTQGLLFDIELLFLPPPQIPAEEMFSKQQARIKALKESRGNAWYLPIPTEPTQKFLSTLEGPTVYRGNWIIEEN